MKKSLPILLILAIITILMINFFKRSSKELKFTKEFFILLSKNVPDLELVSIMDLEIRTKHKEREHTHYLDNAYSEYLRNENEKEEVLDRYIASTLDLYKPKDKFNLDRIVPVIKDSRYINELKRLANSDDINYYFEKYNYELFILYAQDLENSIQYLVKDEWINNDIRLEELREIAVSNLDKILPKVESRGDDGYYMLTAGGDYEASLILDNSIWTDEHFELDGEIVIAIPSRDVLLVTGSKDQKNLTSMRAAIKEINESGNYLVSDKLFIRSGDKFEIFEEVHER